MVKIYTRKGDDGTTSLWYGGRVAKDDGRTDAYGTLDEANAALGLARSHAGDDPGLSADILRLQDELFVAGAELATSPEAADRLQDGVSRITPQMATELEPLIDKYMDQVDLPPNFVLPGGTTLSAYLDLARTIVRRAERRVVNLGQGGELASDDILRFLNRASDLLFAMARYADIDDPQLFAGRAKGA